VSGPDWRALTVEGERHSAIYAETFPSRLAEALAGCPDPEDAIEAFHSTAALETLSTFAGAWGALHRDASGHRWQYRSLVTRAGTIIVLAFRAVPLDPDERWVVVDDVQRPS
jgi:hypothetical protein